MAASMWETVRTVAFIFVAVVGFILFAAWATASSKGWGFDPVDGTPRIEFGSESECWRYLSRARKVKPELAKVDCTKRDVPMFVKAEE